MKNILLACFYFPPYCHSGVQRPLKFAKYLPLFGYRPIVLTCRNMPWDAYDYETYESEVVGKMTVYQLDAPRFDALNYPFFGRKLPDRLILKLEKLLLEDRLDWTIGVCKQAVRLIDKHRIHLVFTTGPPHSIHFLGYYLKRKTGIPWILDYRDPLIEHRNVSGLNGLDSLFHHVQNRVLFKAYQRLWLKAADRVVAVTDAMTHELRSQHPEFGEKIQTVTNGFDENDFHNIYPTSGSGSKFTMLYTGRCTPPRSPMDFLAGLKKALAKDHVLKKELKILFIGSYSQEIVTALTAPDLQGIVHYLGPASHYRAVAYQSRCDVSLLLMAPTDSLTVPGKLFEYMRAGRPILALSPDGEARNIVERNGLGLTVEPSDHDGISRAILRLHEMWRNKTLAMFRPSRTVCRQYDRRNLTQRLSMLLDGCLQ